MKLLRFSSLSKKIKLSLALFKHRNIPLDNLKDIEVDCSYVVVESKLFIACHRHIYPIHKLNDILNSNIMEIIEIYKFDYPT